MGELVGYSKTYRVHHILNVVAPSRLVAEAWALNRESMNNPVIVGTTDQQIDGFVQDHIW